MSTSDQRGFGRQLNTDATIDRSFLQFLSGRRDALERFWSCESRFGARCTTVYLARGLSLRRIQQSLFKNRIDVSFLPTLVHY